MLCRADSGHISSLFHFLQLPFASCVSHGGASGCRVQVLARNGFPEVSEAEYREATRFTTPARLAFHAKTDPDHSIGLELAKQSLGIAR